MGTEPTDSDPHGDLGSSAPEERLFDHAIAGGDSSATAALNARGSGTAKNPSAPTARRDPYGLDPEFEASAIPALDWLYRTYFRVDHDGLEHVPGAGRCLIIANHSGTLPLDGLMLRTLVRLEHPSRRSLRWLASDFIHSLAFVGSALTRLGAVRESQPDAERLLLAESLVATFPEGIAGIGKLFRDRYRVQRFGRGGFIRLALRTQTPVIPCAIIGAEETSPMLYRLDTLPRLLGLPYLPITPTFPWLGPAGLLPAPTKWRIVFGQPLSLAEFCPGAERDARLVAELTDRVRNAVQAQLDNQLARRRTIWRG